MKRIGFLLLALSCAFSGCNPMSGEWKDDGENWQRAFNGMAKPDFVEVHHSLYYRSPHFTYEAFYFFEFDAPEDYVDTWVQRQSLQVVESSQGNLSIGPDLPTWFAPKDTSKYILWGPPDDERSNFRILKDKESGRYFVCDSE